MMVYNVYNVRKVYNVNMIEQGLSGFAKVCFTL